MSKPSDIINKIDLVSLMNIGRRKPRPNSPYARFNRRMMAVTIDSFFLLFLQPFFNWAAPIHQEALQSVKVESGDPHAGSHAFLQVLANQEFMTSWFLNLGLQILVFCIFSGICWHFWSATPGKILLRTKIVDATTQQPISDKQILIRLLGYWVSILFFLMGIFWIGIDKKRRGWHDFMAHTVVVAIPWKKKEGSS